MDEMPLAQTFSLHRQGVHRRQYPAPHSLSFIPSLAPEPLIVNTARSMRPNQASQSPGRPHTKPYVVVIFGRTGVGISSLVNLITGYPISKDHSNAKTKASKIKPHPASFPPSNKEFWLYEVPGFGGSIQDRTILKTIRQIERDVGIDLFIYCFRKQKATVLSDIGRRIRDSVPQRVPMIAVVTELERFEAEMDEWWDGVLDDEARFTNGTKVERMCFGGDDGFDAHACVTTLPRNKVDLLETLRKRRDLSEDRIRRLILEHCRGPKRVPDAEPGCRGCL